MLRIGLILLMLLLAAGCATEGNGGSTQDSSGPETTSAKNATTSGSETTGMSAKEQETTGETTAASAPRSLLLVEQIVMGAPGQGPKRPRVIVASSASALSKELGKPVEESGKGTYIAALWGEKPTGGYTIAIGKPLRVGKMVTVELDLKKPPRDAFVSQSITYPYVVAVIRDIDPSSTKFTLVEKNGRRLDWPIQKVGV